MAATITATGTWTTINVDFSKTPKTGPNTMVGNSMQLEQLKSQDLRADPIRASLRGRLRHPLQRRQGSAR